MASCVGLRHQIVSNIEGPDFKRDFGWYSFGEEGIEKAHSLISIKQALSVVSNLIELNVDEFDFSRLIGTVFF